MKKTKIENSGNYVAKAPVQIKKSLKPTVNEGGDLRAAKTGGTKAKS